MVLGVSESGYYRFLKSRTKPSRKAILSASIKEIYDEHPYNDNYGVERIRLALEQRGIDASKYRIRTIMRENGWLHSCRTPHGITKATTEVQEKENLIKQDFTAEEPYTKLLTDITEIQCKDGKYFNEETNHCDSCPNECTTCLNSTYCLSCSDGYSFTTDNKYQKMLAFEGGNYQYLVLSKPAKTALAK